MASRASAADFRPDHIGVAMYDGLSLIYAALQKTHGDTSGDALIAAMRGMSWESPRGIITIDPDTRDIIQDVYMRRVERRDGQFTMSSSASLNG